MQAETSEVNEFLNLLKKETKMVAMLAPSFPVDFHYESIIGMLKRLGFKYVLEISRGATETNKQLLALMKLHPERRYITSPCPSIMRIIRNKYPELLSFLALVDSPMSATAKIAAKEYPGYKKVNICPCFVKKLEAREDYPDLDILSLTYQELQRIFDIRKIKPRESDKKTGFDIVGPDTRLYPISGGLAQSSGITQGLTDAEYDVVSGPVLSEKTLKEFPTRIELKVLDILFCEGGCINGPGIISRVSLEEKRKKVTDYWKNIIWK